MLCNVCGVNEASIHLTEIINNQMIEMHLCESCAQEKGTDFKTHFNFGDLLAGLSDTVGPVKEGEKRAVLKCSGCGMIYDEFSKTGRLGCAQCYDTFSRQLMPLVKRIQRSTTHLGKRPVRTARETRGTYDLRMLQNQLRKCIEKEEYEKAARLRDEIKQLEEKGKKGRKNLK